MRKLLWVGDACVSTGFARATHNTLDVLRHSWEVTVLGISYLGDPHPYHYNIYPAWIGGDAMGSKRLAGLVKLHDIDCIVLQNDVWNIPPYIAALREAGLGHIPVVAALAIDGKNCQSENLNGISLAIFWTKFAEREARLGGYTGPSAVVPLGIDLEMYKPLGRSKARSIFNVKPNKVVPVVPTEDSYIVLNVNRNQHRKRLDLTCLYFCDWVEQYDVKDVFLMLHAAPTGEEEYDVEQLMTYRGHRDKLLFFKPNIGHGVPEKFMSYTYGCADVMLSTTQGEGFGLTTFEGMACGVPQIVPDWSGLGELVKGVAWTVPCTSVALTQNRINVIGGVPDRDATVDALQQLYHIPMLRENLRSKGLTLVHEPRFRWENIGRAFGEALELVVPVTHEEDACLSSSMA